MSNSLQEKLANKSAVVGVIGLGYVGLPLAVAFAEAGLGVMGFDILGARVDAVNSGQSYIADVTSSSVEGAVAKGPIAGHRGRKPTPRS